MRCAGSATEDFDVLVIGGGITGAGVALDAATRGLAHRTRRQGRLRVGDVVEVVEARARRDPLPAAEGSRPRLRGAGRAADAAQDRAAPRARAAVPAARLHPATVSSPASSPGCSARRCGCTTSPAGFASASCTSACRRTKRSATCRRCRATGSPASYVYYDAQADDARLTLTVARTAADYGAAVANYATLVGLGQGRRRQGHLGASRRRSTATSSRSGARSVVNATGVWADDVRAHRRGHAPRHDPARQGHPHHGAVGARAQRDRRGRPGAEGPPVGVRRAVGRRGNGEFAFTYIGTTDTDYDGPLDDPQCTPDDIAYLLRAINASSATTITENDILGTWAGLRPLVRDAGSERTADLSRRHSVPRLRQRRGHGDRRQAHDLPAHGRRRGRRGLTLLGRRGRSRTKRVTLHGATGWDAPDLPPALAGRYGADARERARAGARGRRRSASRSSPASSTCGPRSCYAVRNEMAQTVDDVLSRRTRARLLARDASADAAADVAALMAAELGWDDAEQERQVEHYRALVGRNGKPADCPSTALDALAATPVVGADSRGIRRWQTNRGAPTPPIAFPAAPRPRPTRLAAAAGRGRRRRSRRGSSAPAPTSSRVDDDRERGEPRLVAARDDLGARRPGRRARERCRAPERRRTSRRDPPCLQRRRASR